jgi:pyruvate/2-oxoglutarate dehydrogenase complex dihydrolipoamide dehydrogenase (E3) component
VSISNARQADSTYDVVVIGGGPPGENAAQYAIQGSDRSAVLIEAELVGGECSYWACMPSKALLHPIEVHASAAALPGTAPDGPIDVAQVLERRDAFTHHRDDSGQVAWAEGANIQVVRGRARLAGPKLVEVALNDGGTVHITARHAVVLATGTSASIPPVPGLAEALPWTSRDATNLTVVPARVAIIGGGVVAAEAATWFNGLGAAVTMIVREGGMLGGREPFVSEIITDRFTALGITVLSGTETTGVSRDGVLDSGVGNIHGGPVTIHTATSGEDREQTLEVDEVVVAAGRRPNSTDLGLEQFALDTHASHGFVSTDDHLAVLGVPSDDSGEAWLYAVGDITGRALLTHMGKYQGRIAGAVIGARAEGRPTEGSHYLDRADHGAVPGVIFTDPQVASVGLTEAQAREQGIKVEALEYDLASVAGASLLRDDYVGRAKLVIDASTDLIVGATFVGADVQELLHSATTAIVGKVTVEDLWHVVPSYPTVSEVWLRLLEQRPVSAWQ